MKKAIIIVPNYKEEMREAILDFLVNESFQELPITVQEVLVIGIDKGL